MKKTRKLLEPYPLSISHGQMKPRLGSVFAANMMVFFGHGEARTHHSCREELLSPEELGLLLLLLM
jgi:hypothetical protein